MILFIVSIFTSAFLLFQVQPMISRFVLPFFGGTPAVWSAVEMFFQIFLTGGYAYAYWLIGHFSAKKQVRVHLGVLWISLLVVGALGFFWPSPVTPGANWTQAGTGLPVLDIFLLLTVAVGLPYFLLCTNSPLIQAWFHRSHAGRSPYWLYALSNIGSLLGLLAYPFLIEPHLTLKTQGWAWSGGYALFVLLVSWVALKTVKAAPTAPVNLEENVQPRAQRPAATFQVQLLWVLLSAIASTMLLATTSQMTQEVATTPFLWVLPLSIYLLSFILTYSDERWYNRAVFGALMIPATAGFIWALADTHASLLALIGVYCFLLFVCVMICNGEAYRLRPDPSRLTRFYLLTSVGGALGGIAVNLIAPWIFKGYWELPLSFGLVVTLTLALFVTRRAASEQRRIAFIHNVLLVSTVLMAGGMGLYSLLGGKTSEDVFVARNFYGVTRVKEINPADPAWHGYTVVHGTTIHGLQFTSPDQRDLPTSYYSENSGVGLALVNHPKYGHGMRVGVLGLGIGTLAAYSRAGDVYRYYEINPIMVDLAQGKGGYFGYLAGSLAKQDVIVGDARISLAHELAVTGSNRFDFLAIDCFSGDSPPLHLITREAFNIYLENLAPDGVIAFNISNRYLDFIPVLWQQAQSQRLAMQVIASEPDSPRAFPALWVLLARDPALIQNPAISDHAVSLDGYRTSIPLWTDDFNNLFQILK
jgi:hypothetical protein